jgi:hypothetical protein
MNDRQSHSKLELIVSEEHTRREAEMLAEVQERRFEEDKVKHGFLKALRLRAKYKGLKTHDLTVLSAQVDPFGRDTPANHRNAQWFKEQIDRFVGDENVHLRGLHYKCIGNVYLPSGGISQGMPYINDRACWLFILDASKAARWLGYVPFSRIFDNRNDPPLIYVPDKEESDVIRYRGSSVQYDFPERDDTLPCFLCTVKGRQPYRIVFFGEKSSLALELEPIAKEIGAELVLCTGEASDTRIEEIVERAVDDGRPLIILYFSDFDPSGWQMSISVSRKIQACKNLLSLYADLDAQVFPVALNLEQIKKFELPETPIKEEESRGDRWVEHWNHEQTEIDSLLALHPGVLTEITRNAIKPFYDDSLSGRSTQAWWAWHQEAERVVKAHPGYDRHRDTILKAYDDLKKASDALNRAQQQAYQILTEVEPPEPEVPEPNITAEAPEPIFTTADDYETASLKLIKRKRLEDE